MDLPSPTSPQGDDPRLETSPVALRCSDYPPRVYGAGRKTTIKGNHAKFLYENPRFINEPIRYMVPERGVGSVGACLDWSEMEAEMLAQRCSRATVASNSADGDQTFVTSHQSSYLIPTSSSYQLMRKKSKNRTNPIVPNYAIKCQEKISYHHDYNSRLDPNYPPRGKLHGNFVWREKEAASASPSPSSSQSQSTGCSPSHSPRSRGNSHAHSQSSSRSELVSSPVNNVDDKSKMSD